MLALETIINNKLVFYCYLVFVMQYRTLFRNENFIFHHIHQQFSEDKKI